VQEGIPGVACKIAHADHAQHDVNGVGPLNAVLLLQPKDRFSVGDGVGIRPVLRVEQRYRLILRAAVHGAREQLGQFVLPDTALERLLRMEPGTVAANRSRR
jgi:hypothetical protein